MAEEVSKDVNDETLLAAKVSADILEQTGLLGQEHRDCLNDEHNR